MPMFASLVLLLASAPMAAATRGAQPSVSDALAAAHHAEFWPMFDEVAAFLAPVISAVDLEELVRVGGVHLDDVAEFGHGERFGTLSSAY